MGIKKRKKHYNNLLVNVGNYLLMNIQETSNHDSPGERDWVGEEGKE